MAEQKPHSSGPRIHSCKIIEFPVSAAAYAERAMQALERMQVDKALRCFRRAAEIEPANPIHQCNLAGALAETGQHKLSNDILEHVVSELDPGFTECYYYMANNWAHMGRFDHAQVLLEQYVAVNPEGAYAEEAEVMLEMIRYEIKTPPLRSSSRTAVTRKGTHQADAGDELESSALLDRLAANSAESAREAAASYAVDEYPSLSVQEQEHRLARSLLEEGRFSEAVQVLHRILKEDPGYLAAGNNLALAYYYMGRFEEAVNTLNRVLEQDGGNLHALCNLAVFERHAGHEETVRAIIDVLAKMEPLHREHSYKLATTMGILGEHAEAYRHLKKIAASGSLSEPSVFHYAAVAACHMGRYDEAARWWASCRRLDPQSDVSTYYLEQLQHKQLDGALDPMPTYHYRLPYGEESGKQRNSLDGDAEGQAQASKDSPSQDNNWMSRLKRDPLVRSSLFWALRQGEISTRLQAIEAMKMIADDEAKDALRELLTDTEQSPYIRQLCYYVLRRLQVRGPLEIIGPEGIEQREGEYAGDGLPLWQPVWRQVVTLLRKHMDEHYELYIVHDAEVLWMDYLTCCYPDIPKQMKADGWAAAVEYLIAKIYGRELSYQNVASRYEVSAATVSKHVKSMKAVCQLPLI